MDYSLISKKVTEVYEQCKITELPLDIFKVLNHYGFQVFTYSKIRQRNEQLYRICISYSKDAFQFENLIAYNEQMHTRRIPFTLMHELGHTLLSHKEETPENEREADYFSSSLLAPRILIHKRRLKTAVEIHDTFGLSYAASNRALIDYHNWIRNISRANQIVTEAEVHLEELFVEQSSEMVSHSASTEISHKFPCETERIPPIPEENCRISDERLFAYLKNSPIEKRKAKMLKIDIEDYLIYRYGFRFGDDTGVTQNSHM